MDYRLELLSEDKFEDLVNSICQDILGTGVVVFAKGKDGGRDGAFVGISQKYVSTADQWRGKFIIQAKHSSSPISSCSDPDFETKILNPEIEKLKKLKADNELDNYLLFTNRNYTGIIGTKLVNKLKNEVGIEKAAIIGKETINKQYLHPNRHLVKLYDLDKFILPFDFSERELKQLVINFKTQLQTNTQLLSGEVEKIKFNYNSIEKEEKNRKNKLGKEYYDNIILSNSMTYFNKIEAFLQNPINQSLKDYYYDIVTELQHLTLIKREDFGAFEEIFGYISQLVTDPSNELSGKKRFILIFLHYMYFVCDLGIK